MSQSMQHHRGQRRRARSVLGTVATIALVLVILVLLVLFHDPLEEPAFLDEPGAPSLQVEPEMLDFGDVPVARWVTAEFVLTNKGDGRLRLEQTPWVKAVAGC